MASISEAVLEYTCNYGQDNPDQAWILSPYDTWHRNPCYKGKPVAHPEEEAYYEDVKAEYEERLETATQEEIKEK